MLTFVQLHNVNCLNFRMKSKKWQIVLYLLFIYFRTLILSVLLGSGNGNTLK